MLLRRCLTPLAVVLVLSPARVFAADESWFFSAAAIADAYSYQQLYGARLRVPLQPASCFSGATEFTASFHGKEFSAPCKFVSETRRQLKELLQSGAAKYLFPLDADFTRLGVPNDLWESKYSKLASDEILPALLREPSLVAVYHPAQHLSPLAATAVWGKTRSVLGFYDGRRNEILPARTDGSWVDEPQDYRWVEGFTFLAHSFGELKLVANGSVVTLDLSFDDDRAVAAPPTHSRATAEAKLR